MCYDRSSHDKQERNNPLFAERHEKYKVINGPVCGDYVIFAGDVVRRISHIWSVKGKIDEIQTSASGSFYLLDNGRCDFSGGLSSAVDYKHFTLTEEEPRLGECWLFDQGIMGAGRGVYRQLPFKVWRADCPAPSWPSL